MRLAGLLAAVVCAATGPADAYSEAAGAFTPATGYEAVPGITSRAQALIVFEGRSDRRLAVMTGRFRPAPQIHLTTPFHVLGREGAEGETFSRFGYYWKYSYNRFSLDRQEDPDSGGIGPASPVYDYGTRVRGEFLAVAPVLALERVRPDGTVPLRMEVGMGAGYLSLSGDVVLGDRQGQPGAPETDIEYSGAAFFLFTMGQYTFGPWLLGSQLGIMATSTEPYSFSQSYVTLDLGYRLRF